ncbi:uncharacterized protein LOC107042316 [Diachasma alloeum]|uniref:uncharacterized protein LOC107042316 n=1 Tax=Diachasma alloeum TaxID=454923 RepID=UPI00073826E1|nr:uncharacterized protein LOC107042316 [Diachasma alloeum]
MTHQQQDGQIPGLDNLLGEFAPAGSAANPNINLPFGVNLVNQQALNDLQIMALSNFKLTPFISEDPVAWFTQIEAQFRNRRITNDNTKYDSVLEALDRKFLREVSDIIKAPPVRDKYRFLKDQIIKRFSESGDRPFHKLLTEVGLGDQKPSQLLRRMRDLADGKVSEELLRSRWLALLPDIVSKILKVVQANSTLDQLVEAADTAMENSSGFQVMAAYPQHSQQHTFKAQSPAAAADLYNHNRSNDHIEQRLGAIEKAIETLCHALQQLSSKVGQTNARRSRSLTPAPTGQSGLCFYHEPFRDRAPAVKLETLPSVQAACGSSDSNNNAAIKEFRLFVSDKSKGQRFLIDSGSVISIVPRSWSHRTSQPADLKLFAANNTVIDTYGQQLLTLHIGLRRDFKWNFTVANVKTPIIGADLLAHYGLLIDLRGKRLIDPTTNLTAPGEIHETSIFSVSTVTNDLSALSPAISQLLVKFVDITKPPAAPRTQLDSPVAHHIVTSGPPVAERFRRLVGEKLQAARNDIQSLLDCGVIRPSSSQWASPIYMVSKKTGGWRTTGDYRGLNHRTIPDRYPLPIIEDVLQRCRGCEVFTTLDLVRAYHQIPIA